MESKSPTASHFGPFPSLHSLPSVPSLEFELPAVPGQADSERRPPKTGSSLYTGSSSLQKILPPTSSTVSILPTPSAPSAPSAPAPPPAPPSHRYLVLLGSFCALFASFGWRSGSGLFQEYYQLNQLRDDSPSTIAWINSVGFFLMFFGAIFVQPLNQKFGPRRVLFVGSCMHVGGLLATSWCQTFYQFFLAQGVLSSIGASALFFSSISTLSGWFPRSPAFTIGVSASGTSAGGVVFPLMIIHLLPQIGFGWTMRAVVLVILVLATISFLCIREAPPNPNARRPPPAKGLAARFAGLKERKLAMTLLGVSLFANGYFLVLVFVASVARLRGWQDQVNAIVILNGTSFFGRILPGFLADRLGKYNVMIVIATVSTVLIFALWIPGNNVPASIAFSAIFGFTSGSTISLGPAMVIQVSPLAQIMPNMAVLYLVESIAALIVSPIGGALLTAGNNIDPLYLQVFAGVITTVGTLLIVVARWDQSGPKLITKI